MTPDQTPSARVTVTGIDIPFGTLVVLVVKVALAALPAYLLLFLIMALVFTLVGRAGALLGSLAR